MSIYRLWECPYCGRGATIRDSDHSIDRHRFSIENRDGLRVLVSEFYVCPNGECNKFQLVVSLHEGLITYVGINSDQVIEPGKLLKQWILIPPSKAKPFPSYIPDAIISDYTEACLIADLSPKASATLSRRCLQGIIRDYWGVRKSRLKDEILAIQDKCDALTWSAIDGTRKIGNIGAHMEEDINLIIDVDPEEAGLLISLVEMLLKEWYIGKHDKEETLKKIAEASQIKDDQKKATE